MMKYFEFIIPHKHLLGDIEGLNQKEICEIEKEFKIKLPVAYKEFLGLFGKKTGNLLKGYYMTFDNIAENRKDLNDMFITSVYQLPIIIKDTYFIFGQWQGSFLLFDCLLGDNPEIYFMTGADNIEYIYPSFVDFIKKEGLKYYQI